MSSAASTIFGGGQQNAGNDMAQGYQMSMQQRQQYLNQIQNLLQPYMNQGTASMGAYNNALSPLGQQFASFLNPAGGGGWAAGYQATPYAKYLENYNQGAINNAAAASGMIGSGTNMRDQANMANNIASQDMQQYYNNMMGMGNMYLGGMGNLMNQGFNATSNLGNYMFGTGEGMAGDEANMYGARGYADQGQSNMWNNIMGDAGSIAAFL